MKTDDIVSFLKGNVTPVVHLQTGEEFYRCAAKLTDDTDIHCVVIQDTANRVELAQRRFKETGHDESIIQSFVCSGNHLNGYDIESLKPSPYLIPVDRLGEIEGETSMGWTEFVAVMNDGETFCFGTSYHTFFFNMPDSYTGNDIVKIIPAVRNESRKHDVVYRERPFFDCYIEGLRKDLTRR